MPLNYSKWDALELSDDSDIEGHPNVDKKSLIRWKQRDIHEKRAQRAQHIQALEAEIKCNSELVPRLANIADEIEKPSDPSLWPRQAFGKEVERLKTNPSDEKPTDAPGQKTYDEMVLSLLLQVGEAVKGDDSRLAPEIRTHVTKLEKEVSKLKRELDAEKAEQKKHITSDDIHEGWESKYVPPKPEPTALPGADVAPAKKKATVKTTEFETLNPGAVPSTSSDSRFTSPATEEEEESAENLPQLTPSLELFARQAHSWEASWRCIQEHRDIVVPGAADALLVAAFEAESRGEKAYAKACVRQSLALSWSEKLGKDGVRVFFLKMIKGDPRAETGFKQDLEQTYTHLAKRVEVTRKEEEASREQIQLVPENGDASISFNVPDGPPPADLRLEGEGTEDLDIEEVRRALEMRWNIFESLGEDMQEALKTGELSKVNKVLGSMSVEAAERVVEALNMGGILNFADGEIRDETGQAGGDTDEEEE